MSFRSRASAIGGLLVVATIASCTGPGSGNEGETIALRFDWPVGLTAFVQTERSTRKTGPRGSSSATARMFYRIDVEEVPDGRLIRYGDIRAEDPEDGRVYALNELPESLANQLIALFPSYVVSDEAELVRLEGFELLLEEARRRLESRLAELPPESAEARALAATRVSEERLFAVAQEHWDELAGSWSGSSLVVGETYRRDGRLPVLALGGLRISSTREFGVSGPLPCGEALEAADCVEIEVRSRAKPEALARFEEAIREGARAAPSGSLGALENLEIEETTYLLTEPTTLIPHYLETTAKFRASIPRPGEPDIPVEELDQRIYRYRYAAQGGEATAP